MTALHLMAQNILQTTKQIMLPAYNTEFIQREARSITFDDVTLEDIITAQEIRRKPDCVGRITKDEQEYTLWIEFLVTHEVDEKKEKDIKALRQHCIEIVLSDMLYTDFDTQSVKERLLYQTDDRRWISYPELDDKDDRLRLQALEEEKARRLEEEQEQLKAEQRIEAEKSRCGQLAKTWLENPTEELAQQIIQSISAHPFYNEVSIYNFLLANCTWIDFIHTLPKNECGLRVFYIILNYYWKNIAFDYQIYRKAIYKLWFKKSNLTMEESIELECLVSLYIVERLANCQTYYDFVPEENKTLIHTIAKNEDTRKQVFMILSFGYYHPFGSGLNSFEELADHIITSYPALIPLSLQVIESIQQEHPQNLVLINGNNLIDKFREIDTTKVGHTDKAIEQILQKCFPRIFHHRKQEPQISHSPEVNSPLEKDRPTEDWELQWKLFNEWYKNN